MKFVGRFFEVAIKETLIEPSPFRLSALECFGKPLLTGGCSSTSSGRTNLFSGSLMVNWFFKPSRQRTARARPAAVGRLQTP